MVIMHPGYQRNTMKNDIAVIRLDRPLSFNRWVRRICLPELTLLGQNWRVSPEAKSMCVTIGWGATVEHGPDRKFSMRLMIMHSTSQLGSVTTKDEIMLRRLLK